ncbi:MAG TPA: SRPBCC domain-containing protein [Burkholderiaceae bacterium]
MNADELRALQAPLKERYRADPGAALITLRAEGRAGQGLTCSLDTGRALVTAGLHPATGGSGLAACSGDMLLEALVACAGVTLRAVAASLGIVLRDATVHAEGDLDTRGTLGVDRDAPVGFRALRLRFTLDTDAPAEQIATLLKLTERYCVVYQTLRHAPPIEVTTDSTSGPELATARVLAAPRERVFDAIREPARLARWWGPKGFVNTFQEFEFRPGGRWRLVMQGPDGTNYPNESEFAEIVEPERVVVRHLSGHRFDLTIALAEAGAGRTRIEWRQRFESIDECARVAPFVVHANEQNLDRLEAELSHHG